MRIGCCAECGVVFYCIAVGDRAQNLFPQASPPVTFPLGHGQFDRGLAGRMTEHSSGHEEPEAQIAQRHFLLPAQMPLKQDHQVVGQRRQAQRRFARPELFQAQGWQREARR